jgi:hypothetical protein
MNAAGLRGQLRTSAHAMAEAAERLQQAVAALKVSQQGIQQALAACELEGAGEEWGAAPAARMPHQLPESVITSRPGGNGSEGAALRN